MLNKDIRHAMIEANVKQYEVAKAHGCTEACFSRKLREELKAEEKKKILDIIENLKGAK